MRKNNKKLDDLLLICSCGSKEHQLIIQQDEDYSNFIYLSVHLAPLPWYKRIKLAIKYIFGYRSCYGAFEEFIFDKTHVDKLKLVVEHLENND